MYHVIANLELMFGSLEEAKAWAASRPVFQPRVPFTAMAGEDASTPRICGCLDIRGCFTALGVTGTFRRCLNASPDAKSYENDNEAYPVLITKFKDDGWTVPDRSQVPDIEDTGERWLLSPARPEKIYIRWLGAYSMTMREGKVRTKCASLKFLYDLHGYSHPWLDGKGHPLDCPDMGGDPWPDAAGLSRELYLDASLGGHVGFAVPTWPLDGTWTFTPMDGSVPPYRTYGHRLRKFSGCWGEDGVPMFDGCVLEWGPVDGDRRFGTVSYDAMKGWSITPWGGGESLRLSPDRNGRLASTRVRTKDGFARTPEIPACFRGQA